MAGEGNRNKCSTNTHWCGSKIGTPNGTLVNGNKQSHAGLVLTYTHIMQSTLPGFSRDLEPPPNPTLIKLVHHQNPMDHLQREVTAETHTQQIDHHAMAQIANVILERGSEWICCRGTGCHDSQWDLKWLLVTSLKYPIQAAEPNHPFWVA